MEKEKRLDTIKHIIQHNRVNSQEELLKKLTELGFDLTQATLSRDLKQLKVGRIPSEDGMRYVLTNDYIDSNFSSNHSAVLVGFLSISYSKNIAVIKTLPAYAHTVADFIDKAELDEVLGTVAGNDTVMVILPERLKHNQFKNALYNLLPELGNRI